MPFVRVLCKLKNIDTNYTYKIQLNLFDSKSSGPRKILRNTEASDKRITNIHVYLPKNILVVKSMLKPIFFSYKKYVKRLHYTNVV